ncbi:hypothetical protein SAY86_010533 [Trapa natans]|uniref:Uncharacterized protein n=1 Tax=Trapa natans TaxID=22666 RepID=A0AAN7LSG7_TRANT|nr:hypothetical protein SAY86_010533 [Trapa natans]
MPSGAKKRKAAKKKKAHQQHQSHEMIVERDGPKHNEEKDSDGGEGEVLSPASQSHSDPFPNDGREHIEGPQPVGSLASENISSEIEPVESAAAAESRFEEMEGMEIVKEEKFDSSESKTVNIECIQVETVEESVNGSQERNDPVDLNNGSQVIENQLVQEEVKQVALEAASQFSELVNHIHPLPEEPAQVIKSSLVIDSIEPVSSVSEKVIHVTEALIEESPADSLLKLKDRDKKLILPRDDAFQAPEAIPEISSKKIDETVIVVTGEINNKSLSDEREVKLSLNREVSGARASNITIAKSRGKNLLVWLLRDIRCDNGIFKMISGIIVW